MNEVRLTDPQTFTNHLRLTPEKFADLLKLVGPYIAKKDTCFREALSPEIKLQITLRYLASGDSFSTLEHMYRVPKSTISKFLVPVLSSIYKVLYDYIMVPNTREQWQRISNGFSSRWNFPGCCGAIDGKHIRINCPANSGSAFYNYKGYFSTVLFAMVNSNYEFIYIDVGSNGRMNDSSIFGASQLKAAVEDNSLCFPDWGVIVGDDAFPLKMYLMKPYSRQRMSQQERVFNYRLSRARRVSENAFGILASRFRIFLRSIEVCPDKVDIIVKATCAMHNWLRKTSANHYMPPGTTDYEDEDTGTVTPGSWRKEIQSCQGFINGNSWGSHNYSKEAAARRDKYAEYFMGNGAVDWQLNVI